ncbi:MAG: hypothetical protein DHS20C21_06280 [Gemmatimonadota bacterium]|nr:MAG: hypothetical protein DHS20C21_06280 [Gemmatimonadota bacterium]
MTPQATRSRVSRSRPDGGVAPPRRRLRQAVRVGALLAAAATFLILPTVLLGDADPDKVYAEIAVLESGQTRWYSSDQLPPDGRLVFREFASKRCRWRTFQSPREIASWVFRVQPGVDEVRIDVYDGARPSERVGAGHGERDAYEYHRDDFSVS